MTFEHFLYEPPRRFAERLVRGPFRQFEHVHEFMPAGSRTILRDSLEVSLPWYLGGGLTMKLLVAPKLRRFFAYRHAELEQLLRIVPCSAVANREPRL
jgi:ligand-binding SRPBCC domain-containing protein